MRRLVVLAGVIAVLCLFTATGSAAVIYQNDYQGATVGAGFGAWNWTGNACTAHTAVYANVDGNIVVRHTGTINSASGTTGRFGSKWDLTVAGNTSADPADYTISFKLRNVSGNWNPIRFDLAVLTKETGGDYGRTFPQTSVTQADGWVQVEFNLAQATGNWWQGTAWNLTNPRWSLEVGMPGLAVAAGTSWTQVWEMDDFKITMGSDTAPYDPNVTPLNDNGSVGLPINLTQAEVTLGWNAGGDPNIATDYPVNPAILGHNIYLSQGILADDPNVHLVDYIPQVHNIDPALTEPYNEYGPIIVKRGVTYYWQIEEVIDNGATGYPAGDPNNIMGPLWSFDAVPATAGISAVSPAYSAVASGSNLVLSVDGIAVETYQWYKIGAPDVALTNGAAYSGVNTDTLTILDVQLADEGYYYCIGTNSLPSSASNRETGPARVLTQRLMSHYPFETLAEGITPDVVSGFDMRVASNDTGTDVPVLAASTVPGLAGTSSLKFNNPGADPEDPNNVDAQYAQIDEGMLVAYQDITISAWVYSNGGSAWNRIVDFGSSNQNYIDMATNWWGNPGRLGFEIKLNNGTSQAVVSPEGALPNNEWTLVTATLSGDTGRLYVNGELVATNTAVTFNPISFAPTSQNWIARSQYGTGDGYFDGNIDDVKIFNYGLTAQEVGKAYLTVTGEPWVCDWAAWNNDAVMTAMDVDDDCEIDLVDFAAFAGKWLEDAYQISLP